MVVQAGDYSGRRSAVDRGLLIARHFDQRSEGCFAQCLAASKESIEYSHCKTCCSHSRIASKGLNRDTL